MLSVISLIVNSVFYCRHSIMILSTVAWMLSVTFFNVMLSVIIFIVKSVLIVDTQHNNTQQSNLNVEWHIFIVMLSLNMLIVMLC
jgi:hypothetical protein